MTTATAKSYEYGSALQKYLNLSVEGLSGTIAGLAAREKILRSVPPSEIPFVLGLAKRSGLSNVVLPDVVESDEMREWRKVVIEIKSRLLVCSDESTADLLYSLLQDANRKLDDATEPFAMCAPRMRPAVDAANQRAQELLDKLMGKGGAS